MHSRGKQCLTFNPKHLVVSIAGPDISHISIQLMDLSKFSVFHWICHFAGFRGCGASIGSSCYSVLVCLLKLFFWSQVQYDIVLFY